MEPKVSILFPVYNAEVYLEQAVRSLQTQSFENFEVLAYDDGSTDGSWDLLNRLGDDRFRLFRNDRNLGYVVGLNRGIEEARGEYLARMDADDEAHSTRLEQQVGVLDGDLSLGIVGTGCRLIDEEGSVTGQILKPESDVEIRWMALLDNPFVHPTVMMRREILIKHGLRYREELIPTEDYALWIEILQHSKGRNLKEPLLRYRWHPAQISQGKRDRQLVVHDAIAQEVIQTWLPAVEISAKEVGKLRRWIQGESWKVLGGRQTRSRMVGKWIELFESFQQTQKSDDLNGVRNTVRNQVLRGIRQAGFASLSFRGIWQVWRFLRKIK